MFTFNGFLAKLKTKFSTNKTPTNNHRFPLVLSDGTPDGNATPADVMQFLGGITTPISQNDNIDNYRKYGRFTCASGTVAGTLTGLPSGYSGGGFVLFVLPSSQPDNNFRIQLMVNYRCTVVCIRAYQSNVWEGWRTITTNAV